MKKTQSFHTFSCIHMCIYMHTYDRYIFTFIQVESYQHINRDIILSFLSMRQLIYVIIKQSIDPGMGKRNSLDKVGQKPCFSLCDF